MIRVIAENLGYREIERLGAFLKACSNKAKYYDNINRWLELGFEYVEIGYDLHYDEPYMTNECDMKLYESDFE